MGWLDLHMHSNISNDGEFSPQKLMELCSENSIKVAALADHNSVRGIKDAKIHADKLGIKLISAIELDCSFKDVDLHILGYGIDPDYPSFTKVEKDVEAQEIATSQKRMELVKSMGISFDYAEVMNLSPNGAVTGEMIAEAALKDENNKDNVLMRPFYPGGNRSDNPYVNFYWDFCSKGKGAYVPMKFISLLDAIQLIRDAGGIPVLAHPGNNVKENEELLKYIILSGIVGMEVYSSYHSPAQIQFYSKQAEKYNIVKTIGSDFHGKTKPSIKLGDVDCENSEDEIYNRLLQKLNINLS